MDLSVDTNEDASSRQQSGSEKASYQLNDLSRTIQLVNFSLSQKNMIIDTMKADYRSKTEELEERLADVLHQKQGGQLHLAQEELRKQQRLHKQKMEAVLARKQQLEEMNCDLCPTPREVLRYQRLSLELAANNSPASV